MLYTALGDFVLWALVVFGLTYLVVAASVARIPRYIVWNLLPKPCKGVLECGPCSATWIGMALGAVGFVPMPWTMPLWSLGAVALRVAVGGLMSMALVAAFQFVTKIPIAELADAAVEETDDGDDNQADGG